MGALLIGDTVNQMHSNSNRKKTMIAVVADNPKEGKGLVPHIS